MSIRASLWKLALGLMAAALALGSCGNDQQAKASGGGALRIGMLLALTGPGTAVGNPLAAGAQVWVDSLNAEKGGIAGKHKVELVLRDIRGGPATAVQAYNGLKREVVMFNVFGTAEMKALLPQLERDRGAALPTSLDADWIREPNLIPIGVPYQIEAINILDYYRQVEAEHRGRTVCAMGDNGPAGAAALEGVHFATRELGLHFAETAHFSTGDQEFTAQINQLQGGGCNAIVLVASPTDTARILSAAIQSRFSPRWLGLAPTWAASLANSPLKDYLKANYWLVHEGAQYGDMTIPGMPDFLARLKRHPPTLEVAKGDARLINGYAIGQVMTTLLEQAAKDGDLSKQGILRAITRVGTVSFGGLVGDYYYGPIDKRGPDRTSPIFKVDPTQPFGLTPIHAGFKSNVADGFKPERHR
jgi:ABC-type branched-subunit amino acid transport system substrate-binding protein